jgi:MoaA/NifB/PqqE/SkfB family radical SAM enzyme
MWQSRSKIQETESVRGQRWYDRYHLKGSRAHAMNASLPQLLKSRVSRVLPEAAKRKYQRIFAASLPTPTGKENKPIEYWIDVVSGCNLRCTACPVGMPEFSNSIGQQLPEMDLGTFEKICLKAKHDTDGNLRIGLYNWTEPTIHSRLNELIAIAIHHDIPVGISSNLNHDYDWQLLKPLDLWNFTITVSGFTQKTYAINHRGGRIEPVLANLIRISQQLSDWPSYKNIDVRYLVHRDNQHEVALFKHFCDKLGLRFTPYHAYYMPIDRMFEGLEDTPTGFEHIEYSPQAVSRAIGSYRSRRCHMRDNQVTLDMDGNYYVCCVESPSAARLVNYLDDGFAAMQSKRVTSELFAKCISKGINIFATHGMEEPVEIQEAIQSCLPFDINSLVETTNSNSPDKSTNDCNVRI